MCFCLYELASDLSTEVFSFSFKCVAVVIGRLSECSVF